MRKTPLPFRWRLFLRVVQNTEDNRRKQHQKCKYLHCCHARHPLIPGDNLAVSYQQLHYSIHGFILSINRSSGRFLCICLVFSSYYTQNRHTSRCACFPYITLYPATRCLLPQNQQIGYCTCRDDDDPAGKRSRPLEPPPEQRQEQPERKQMIPRLLIRQLLPLYRQHHRPVQTRRRFPRPSRPAHGISR